MDLKKQSEIISCNHITFLEKKYKLYNEMEFKKKLIPTSRNISNIKDNYLIPRYISKKDCIYESTEPNQGLWEINFENPKLNPSTPLFNINTKAKINQAGICP
jgi:hypothetical protein